MIYSMTGFSRKQSHGGWGNLVCEMRSINYRYTDINVYLPDLLRTLEMPIRERIKHAVRRGKIDINIRYQASSDTEGGCIAINATLVKEFCRASENIAGYVQTPAPISVTDILRFPGVIEAKEVNIDALQPPIFQLVDQTLQDLLSARQREGEELTQLFLQRMELMQEELKKVRQHLPQIMVDQRNRLLQRFADASITLDNGRLEQEMVLFAQKIDVSEEIERLETHITEVRRVLKQGGMVGRRLDFLLQELNREANTLGSKSTDSTLTHAAVEMKVLIEQIREQVQNVE